MKCQPAHRLHMKKLVLAASCLVLLVAFISRNTPPPFPDDLLYEGEPIHPLRIVATQFGDSSHWDPKPVIPPNPEESEEEGTGDCYQTLDYDKENNSVMWIICRKYDDQEDTYSEGYRYIGTYKGRHVVETSHWGTSSSGRFMELGLVRRVDDTIVNAGEITGGDRYWGGVIHAESLKGNILRYQQHCQLYCLMEKLTGEPYYQRDISPIGNYCTAIYEADLDTHVSVLWGIKLNPLHFASAPSELESYDDCYDQVAFEYVKQGKCILNLEETKHFAGKVMALIEKSKLRSKKKDEEDLEDIEDNLSCPCIAVPKV